jgi:hypothetical protein
MDRWERYGAYLITWGRGSGPELPASCLPPSPAFAAVALASGVGIYQHTHKLPLMSLDAFDAFVKSLERDRSAEQPDDSEALRRELEHEKEEREHAQRLLFERCDRDREVRAILEASPDETTATAARRVMAGECDVGPSDRDRRIEAEAHARLSKLILAGGKVETGGRSLYESAGDEIVRLRGELERMHAERDEVRGILDPRRDPGTVASKARHVVEDLARERELYLSMCREKDAERARAGKAETALFAAREDADRLRGALYAANRLLDKCDDSAERRRIEIDAMKAAARAGSGEAREQGAAEMRERAAAYLDAHAAEDELDGRKREAEVLREIARRVRDIPLSGGPDYGAKVGQVAAGERAASRLEPDVPALTEEDRYTLRGDEWEEQDDGRWFKTFVRGCDPMDHGLFDPRTPGGLRALRERARRIRAKVPPAPHGVTGEASGGDRAAGGEGSVAEAQGEKQGAADETPLQRAVGLLHRAMWHRTAEFLRNGELTPRKALEKIRGFISDVPADVDDAAAMAALEALIASSEAPALRCVGCGAGRGHADSPHACAPVALPKPARVEVGQRWRFDVPIVDPVDLVVEGVLHGDGVTLVSVRSASGRIWFDLQQDWLLNGGAWTFLGTMPQGPSPKRDEAEPAGCNDILEGRPTTATDEHTDGPTARDAVAGMLLRQGYPGSAEDLAKDRVSAKDLAAEFRADALVVDESPACIAALDALDRGDLCGARDHVGLAAVISRVAGERDELRRERDEARAEAAALREEVEELKGAVDRFAGRAADLEKQRDEACKDALDAMRESRALREDRDRALRIAEDLTAVTKTALRDASPLRPAEDIAREHVEARKEGDTFWFGDNKESIVLSHRFTDMSRGVDCVRRILTRHIERGRAEGKRAPVEAPRAQEAQSGMRIEKRADGEWLINTPRRPNDCTASIDRCGIDIFCCHHVDGEHVGTHPPDANGVAEVIARWPIAPSQDEPPSQVVAESDRIESADGSIVVEMPKDADARWQPGAVWEHMGCRLTLDAAARFSASKDPYVAHFCRRAPVRVSDMTPENGWRYVGRPASGYVPTWSAEPQWSEEERDALWAGEPDHGPYLSLEERAEIDARVAAAPVVPSEPSSEERGAMQQPAGDGKAHVVINGDVTVTAPERMTLGEVWEALKSSPALRVCLDAELRQARESARGTTPAELEDARRDIRSAVLEDAFRAGAEEGTRAREAMIETLQRDLDAALSQVREVASAAERAHADGIVEGLTRAVDIAGSVERDGYTGDGQHDVTVSRIKHALDLAKRGLAPADRHVDRAALLQLATGWNDHADESAARADHPTEDDDPPPFNRGRASGLRIAARDLRRLLDAPRDGAPCPGPHQDLEACDACVEPAAAPGHRALAEQIVPAAVYVNERAPYFGPALRDDGKPGVQLTSYFGAEDSRDARAKVVEHVAALLRGAAAKSG